jgi:hypothetical protein
VDDDPIAEIVREARRKRYLGPNAQCHCGERNIWALVRRGDWIVCYECLQQAQGRPADEQHHILGQHNDHHTIAWPGNSHRITSAYRVAWPMKTQRNPHRSPLRGLAAAIRSEIDSRRFLAERVQLMERLDDWLCAKIGPEWPHEFEQYLREHE